MNAGTQPPLGVIDTIQPSGFDALQVQAAHVIAVAFLGPLHGDLFDRMLVAQAMAEQLIFLTLDETLIGYGPWIRLADWRRPVSS